MLRTVSLSLALLAIGASASIASAKPKVVVFPITPLPGEVELSAAQEMSRSLLEEMQGQKGYEAVLGEDPARAVSGPDSGRAPARSDQSYRAALVDLQEGAEQAKKLRLPQAIRALEKGIAGLEASLDLLDDYNRLIDAYLLLAVAHFRKGKEAAGADLLENLSRLRPDYELEAGKYPPIFVSVFEKARARVLERERGSLRVTSAPAAATVLLNGREVGKTPLRIDEVVPGANHVVLKLGERSFSKIVDVKGNDIGEAHADLGAGGPDAAVTLGDAIAANRFDRDVRQACRQRARDAGADYVVVLAMGRGMGVFALGGFLGNAKTGKWIALSPVAPDFDMLSASIEAHSLAREVATQIDKFGPDIGNETIPFVAGKSVQAAKRSGGLKESRVAFVGGVVSVSAAASGGRRPARAAEPDEDREPSVAAAPEPPPPPAARIDLDADADPDAGSSGRRPLAAGSPREAPRPKAEPVAARPSAESDVGLEIEEEEVVPAKGRRGPVTSARRPAGSADRGDLPEPPLEVPPKPKHDDGHDHAGHDHAGHSHDVGPVAGASIGIELDESDEGRRGEEIAAMGADGTGPLAIRDLDREAGDETPLIEKWWFWTAIAVGVGVIAGGAVLLFHDPDPTSVQVVAVW